MRTLARPALTFAIITLHVAMLTACNKEGQASFTDVMSTLGATDPVGRQQQEGGAS